MIALPVPVSWLADTSLRVSIAVVGLMLMRPGLRKWVGNPITPWLWLILALRLLMPWPVQLPWNILPAFTAEAALPALTGPKVRLSLRSPEAEPSGPAMQPARIRQPGAARATPSFWRSNGWNVVWLAGLLASLLNFLRAWRQTLRWASLTVPGDDDPRLREAFASIPVAQRKGVTLRVTRALDVPTLFGVWRPQIWMPQACLDRLEARELRHILVHELGHARRRDLLAQWVWSLACSVHWFNPLVWIAARLAQADRELACDAWVLAREGSNAGNDFATEYGRTLIRVVEHLRTRPARAHSATAVAMATGNRNLGLRVREIGRFQPPAPGRGLAVAVVMLAGVALLTTGHTVAGPGGAVASSPGSAPAISASPSPAPDSTPAPPPVELPHPSRKQLDFEGRMVALSKTAVAELKAQKGQFPEAESLIDQLTGAFAQKEANGATQTMPFVCQVVSEGVSQRFLQRLFQMKGLDLISAPHVTTKPDQKATVEIIREYLYPTKFDRSRIAGIEPVLTPQKFEKKNVGLTLEIEAGLSPADDAVDFNIHWQLVDVQSYVGKDGKPAPMENAMGAANRPVFSTQEIQTCVTMPPYSTLVLGSMRYNPATWQTMYDHKTIQEDAIVLLFVNVKLVSADARNPAEIARDENTAALRHKVATIIVPSVEFHDLELTAAVEFLRQEAARLDPESNPDKRGVNLFLKLPLTGAPAARVTLSANNVSVFDALQKLAAQVGLKVAVEEYAVSLVPLTEVTDKMATVEREVKPEVAKAFSPPVVEGAPAARIDPRPWLAIQGMVFPPGSSATYLPKSGKLVVRNTQENLDRLEIILWAPPPAATPEPSRSAADLPYGTPVEGKPGFVKSPHAPDAGYVDLRGFERGVEVKDPYTGKLFLVP